MATLPSSSARVSSARPESNITSLSLLDFFEDYGEVGEKFPCWVSHLDPNIAITDLDLRRLKKEVMYSLVPLAVFILFTLYAFCRLGVFSICNPFRCCPTPADQVDQATLTPKQLFRSSSPVSPPLSWIYFRYKKTLMAKKAAALQSFQKCDVQNLAIPSTIVEDTEVLGAGLGQESTEQAVESEKQRFVFVESENEMGRRLREPSERIEVAVSPAS